MSNAFNAAFAKARATKQQIEQNREDKNHLLAGFVEEVVEAANAEGLSILFTEDASLGERKRARTYKSTDDCDTYYGWLTPLALEGEEASRWSDPSTIPDYAPHVNVYLSFDGTCYAEFSGGFIGTGVGRDRIFGTKKKVNVPPLTYQVGGYLADNTGMAPVSMERLARCLAGRFAGLTDVEAQVSSILNR